MNITCLHCGGLHALFWYQGTSKRELSYVCDKFQSRTTNRKTGYQETRRITKRLPYDKSRVLKRDLDEIPTLHSKKLLKQESDAHQEKLRI